MTVADRYIAAQAWWVASELARRNPHLRIAETDDRQVGASLSVYDPADPMACQVMLNPVAGINIVGDPFSHVEWQETFEAISPHDIVKRVEVGLLLTPASPAPPTNAITIVYRTLAHTLGLLVNDRNSWTVRGERPTDESIFDGITWAGDTSDFGSLEDLVEQWFDEDPEVLNEQGITHLWVLWKNLQPVAAFDLYGRVHTRDGVTDLVATYRACGSRFGEAVTRALGACLP